MSAELAICLILSVVQQPHAPPHPNRPHVHHGDRITGNAPGCDQCRFPFSSPICGPVAPGFCFDGLLPHSFYCETVSTVDFFGPPIGFAPFGAAAFDPFGFGGFGPVYSWPAPAFSGPVFFGPAPGPVIDQRVPPRFAQPAPRGTTDIPERLIDDLIGRRHPTLAQRAQAARLEGAGDRLFQAGHFARAAERYRQALGQTPDNDDAKFKRGAALAAAGQFGEAGRTLRDALHDRPDWPFVAHDLRTLFPDDAAIAGVLEKLDRESRRPDADRDAAFLRAYILYFTGERAAAAAIFQNPPAGGSTTHYEVFQEAIERQRGNR